MVTHDEAIRTLDHLICELGISKFLDCAGQAMGEHSNALRDNGEAYSEWQAARGYSDVLRGLSEVCWAEEGKRS